MICVHFDTMRIKIRRPELKMMIHQNNSNNQQFMYFTKYYFEFKKSENSAFLNNVQWS